MDVRSATETQKAAQTAHSANVKETRPLEEMKKEIFLPIISPLLFAHDINSKDLQQSFSKIDKLLRQGKFLNAIILAKKTLRAHKDNPSALIKLGEAYLGLQKLDVAQKCFERAKSIDSNLIDAYLGLASIEGARGQFTNAIKIYDQALLKDPTNYEANFYKGEILFNLSKYKEAKVLFEKAKEIALQNISQNKNDIDSHLILGKIYQFEGNFGLTIKELEIVYGLEPDNVENNNLLGNAYKTLSNLKKALTIYQAALDAGNEDFSLWIGLCQTKYSLGGRENFEEVFDIYDTFEEFLSLNPKSSPKEKSDFLYLHADISFTKGKYKEAIRLLEEAKKMNPNNIMALMLLANSYLTLSQYEKALSVSESILKLQPANWTALIVKMNCYSNLAVLHRKIDAMSQAEEYQNKLLANLERAEKYFPRNLEILQALKDMYSGMGEYEKTITYLGKIISLMPKGLSNTSRFRRELKNKQMYLAVTEGRDFDFDQKKVAFSKLESFEPQPLKENYKTGKEFNNFIQSSVGDVGYYFIADEKNLRNWIRINSGKDIDLSKLSVKEAIVLAAQLTELIVTYRDKTAVADLAHIPIEAKISNGNGVCRHYVPIFIALFNTIKSVNPNLANIYASLMINSHHTWNVIFEVRRDKIIAVPIDLTFDDDDQVFGNNLEALNDEHFNRFDQAVNHNADSEKAIKKYEQAIKRFPDAKWIDSARLMQARLYFVQGKYNEAKATLISILKLYPQTERLADIYDLLGIITLRQGNLEATIEYLEKLIRINISHIEPGTKIKFTLVDENNTPVLPAEAVIEMKIVEEDGKKVVKSKVSITHKQIEQLRKKRKLQKATINLKILR
ncbi:hypothetical protein AMJ44_09765 [candidate division WOR-1 bacterium DG_54_3]|uniref:Outer membrane lipoprotein BamD-like domain-containing protein n=1 Tax=candidate division WOR-1 bacterium DG_54_3 TaxID=1703775 RepID=A0A0S7XT99_UNCSA|nr:MAG: hypothetical protein AMJ44_09765 [candidate division WOR-1 bacterium DG_54_3]